MPDVNERRAIRIAVQHRRKILAPVTETCPVTNGLVFVLAIRRKAKGSVRTTATIDSRSNMPT